MVLNYFLKWSQMKQNILIWIVEEKEFGLKTSDKGTSPFFNWTEKKLMCSLSGSIAREKDEILESP